MDDFLKRVQAQRDAEQSERRRVDGLRPHERIQKQHPGEGRVCANGCGRKLRRDNLQGICSACQRPAVYGSDFAVTRRTLKQVARNLGLSPHTVFRDVTTQAGEDQATAERLMREWLRRVGEFARGISLTGGDA